MRAVDSGWPGTADVKSQQLIQVLQEVWKPVFGIPAKLRVDPGDPGGQGHHDEAGQRGSVHHGRRGVGRSRAASNEKEIVRGYSPAQHALGRAPDCLGRFSKALLDYVYNDRLAPATNSKGRALTPHVPGDLVYWTYQAKGKGNLLWPGSRACDRERKITTWQRHLGDQG